MSSAGSPLSSPNKPKPLVMTDYWFLFGMWVMVYWAIDPWGWKVDFIPVIKQLPVLVIAPAFVLAALGHRLFLRHEDLKEIKFDGRSIVVAILLFSLFVTGGSVVARFFRDIQNSFLTMGLFALTAPLTVWFILQSANPKLLLKRLLHVYLFWAIVAALLQFANFSNREVFHAREHLVIGSLVFFYLIAKSNLARAFALIFVIATAIAAMKNSAYLAALIVLIFVGISWTTDRASKIRDRYHRFGLLVLTLTIALISFVMLIALYFAKSNSLPTGNPEYRLHTYKNAWDKFLQSPVWGTGFASEATEKFDKFSVAVSTQVLPTHSDPLDILAHGGLIGFACWIFVFVALAFRWRDVLTKKVRLTQGYAHQVHTLFCIVFSGLVVCAFNPIMNSPNLAWSFWALIGALVAALHLYRERNSVVS